MLLYLRSMSWWLGVDWQPEKANFVQRRTEKPFPCEYLANTIFTIFVQTRFCSVLKTTWAESLWFYKLHYAFDVDWIHNNPTNKGYLAILSTGELVENFRFMDWVMLKRYLWGFPRLKCMLVGTSYNWWPKSWFTMLEIWRGILFEEQFFIN